MDKVENGVFNNEEKSDPSKYNSIQLKHWNFDQLTQQAVNISELRKSISPDL